ncbi:MAG: hypothetical protein Q8Q59_02115 [Luteolibacter sp.]|jgi:hypothetical protein|nr:hypothetical protein [Luteolibacter sp.]
MKTKISWIVALSLVVIVSQARSGSETGGEAGAALERALLNEDAAAIGAAVESLKMTLGEKAGIPEVADVYQLVPADATPLTRQEARRGLALYFAALDRKRFWKIGVNPTGLTDPLRVPASVIGCMTAAARAKLDDSARGLGYARDAADFLIWAQQQASAGCYPFPAARGTSSARAMQAGTGLLEKAEKTGNLADTVRNGWVFEDHGNGGLQFDNGECGVAMFELYQLTKDSRHLDSASKAADWAGSRPLCKNWNYNAFSVHLLAEAAAVTGKQNYLAAAARKALLGVIPGQLTDGPLAGRWMDAHNSRPAYHYIMLAALARLASVMPADHPDRVLVMKSLALGLKARNSEIVTKGVMNKDKAIETLLLVQSHFAKDPAFLTDTKTTEALEILCRFASGIARQGKHPLDPRGWGMMLAHLRGSLAE